MSDPWETNRAVSEAAKTLYEQKLRSALEAEHTGEIIAIEPDSGDYVLGKSLKEVDDACRARFGARPVHVFRVGGGGAVKIRGYRLDGRILRRV